MSVTQETTETLREAVAEDRTRLLSDVVTISQIPAPTFDEAERAEHMENRLRETGADTVYQDPEGNVVAQVKQDDVPAICVTAHLDTVFDRSVDHTVRLNDRTITGPGVGDDSLGLASLLSLLRLLPEEYRDHLILVATTGTEGDGNLQGSRYFVDNCRTEPGAALCLEGHRLGRIDHWSLGNTRLRIHVESEGGHVWRDRRTTGRNPIAIVGQLINRLEELQAKSRRDHEDTILNYGMIRGGTAYNTVPYECDLSVEIRSRDSAVLETLFNRVFSTVEEISQEFGVDMTVREVTRRPVSGIEADHWLVETLESIHERLELSSNRGPASSDSCIFLDAGIPTLTLGLADGENKHRVNETLALESLEAGQIQLLMGVMEIRQRLREERAAA